MHEELFQRLCQAQIEGTATESEHAQLARMLDESEPARRDYIEQMKIHAMLSWQHGRTRPAHSPGPEARPERVRWKPQRWMALAAAAVIMLSGTLAMPWLQAGTQFEVLAARGVSYELGERLRQRKIEITSGTLTVKLTSGAVVDLKGPVALELHNSMHVRLLHGSLTADVGTTAKGFIVDTADAHVVDLGTRFGVSAGPSQSTDVAVFEGTVEVYEPASKNKTPEVTLNAGDAIRMGKARKPARLRMIALGADASSLDAAHPSDVVTAVTDNVVNADFRGFYGLIRGGMGEGARAYTTGYTRTWHPMPGGAFPAELAGADGICTFGEDRGQPDLQITLQISRPCDLYVMADARAAVPGWLQRDFIDTGHRLRSGPWIPRETPQENYPGFFKDDSAYVPYTVWRRRITTAGSVVLGPSRTDPGARKAVMYSLAVKGLP